MKKNKFLFIIITLLFSTSLFGAEDEKIVWIFLKPNYVEKYSENKISYSEDKLLKLHQNNWQEDFSDYYPAEEIRQQIEDNVISIRHYSRSLCAYSAVIAGENESRLEALNFVKKIQPVGIRTKEREKLYSDEISSILAKTNDFYGNSLDQLEQLNVVKVHESGYTGEGVRVAVIDAGFRKDHEAFDYLRENGRLIDEYDFINNDTNVQDEVAADTVNGSRQQSHGTAVLSCIVGYLPNTLIAPAYNADVLLAKTEVEGSETRIEEDNYVAAVEWAEENDADIISTSLGYRDFDNFEYSYSELDGETAVTTQAANWAYNRGVLVVTAAGNDAMYFSDGGIVSPGDAWGALTVGAVKSNSDIAYFSSYGPTADGRQKPEVCARGYSTWLAGDYNRDYYYNSNGTSFATPLIAGCCALILEKYPFWTPGTVISNLKNFSDRSDDPDRQYGWGIPDIYKLITETPDSVEIDIEIEGKIVVAPNPVTTEAKFYINWQNPDISGNDNYKVSVYNIYGEKVFSEKLTPQILGTIELITWDLKNKLGKKVSSGIYLVEIRGKKMNKVKKFTVLK